MHEGDIFGEPSLLSGMPREPYLVIKEPCITPLPQTDPLANELACPALRAEAGSRKPRGAVRVRDGFLRAFPRAVAARFP